MYFWTTPDIIMRSWCSNGWRGRNAGSGCTSSRQTDGNRGDVSWKAADPCISGQRPISSCEAGAAMAGAVGMPDPAALHPVRLMAIEAMYPGKRLIHVFLDNARYHHAKLVQQWLARSECRIRLHFIPSYCPHLDPIERLWGLMHRHCTHNKCYAGFKDFTRAVLTFLREKVPRNWPVYRDQVTDNFRVIDPADFRVLA